LPRCRLRLGDESDLKGALPTVRPLKQEIHSGLAAASVELAGRGTKSMPDEVRTDLLCPISQFAHEPILP
jgi:hypothetical protein